MKSTAKLPKDSHSRVIGAEARQIVHSSFDVEHWEYHETTGTDHGLDCIIGQQENRRANKRNKVSLYFKEQENDFFPVWYKDN